MNHSLDSLERIESGVLREFLSDVYPNVRGIRIYNLNEWGYRLRKILVKCGCYVDVVGEKWEVLYPHIRKLHQEGEMPPERAFMNIYAEGAYSVWSREGSQRNILWKALWEYWWIKIVRNICADFYNWADWKFSLKCKGVCFIGVKIPLMEEIKPKLEGEGISYNFMPEVFGTGRVKEIADCLKICGRVITQKEWDELSVMKKSEVCYVAGYRVEIKKYGANTGRKLYVIGACIVEGRTVPEEKETFLYCLSEKMKEKGYGIVGITMEGYRHPDLYNKILDSLTIYEGDVVISIREKLGYAEGKILDLKSVHESRDEYWFYDIPIHTNYAGNQAVAEAVAESVLSFAGQSAERYRGRVVKNGKKILSEDEYILLEKYIRGIQERKPYDKRGKTGAIVMNCNPMTKGHLYLIETAKKRVDYLYIFVVEEERSDICFAERYAMVRGQMEKMENVYVVPSGKFILSYETLPLYFEKAEKQDAVLNAADDLHIFSQYIAPRLGITERFVGEEPTDKVTRQYNEEMKNILPCYGIGLTEIPRLKSGEDYISASVVRKLAEEGDWEAVRRLMPKRAYEIYKKSMGISG